MIPCVFVKILRYAVPIILVPKEGMSSDSSFFMSSAAEKPSNPLILDVTSMVHECLGKQLN